MAILLPQVDLSNATIGTSGTVSFNNAGPTSSLGQYKTPAVIQVYNESGCGLDLAFISSGQKTFLPAGGWSQFSLTPGESGYTYTVVYTLTNANVSILKTIYYLPGEQIVPIAQLGNSPIGGGTVSTNASELVNTGNPPGTAIFNVQPNDATSPTWSGDNSGNLTIKSDNGGTLTTLIQLVGGASPAVKLFASGQQVEVLGNLWADGFSGSNNGIYSNNGAFYGTDGSNTIIQASGTSGTGNTRIQNTDHISLQVPGGTEAIGINSTQITLEKNLIFNGSLGVSTASDVIDATNLTDTYIKSRGAGQIILQQPNGTTVAHFDSSGQLNLAHSLVLVTGSIGQIAKFTGTGSGTVATGISNPTNVLFDPCTASGSSQTIGGTIASSSVVTTGAGLAWSGTAYHS